MCVDQKRGKESMSQRTISGISVVTRQATEREREPEREREKDRER